jgi:hypothetical protein
VIRSPGAVLGLTFGLRRNRPPFCPATPPSCTAHSAGSSRAGAIATKTLTERLRLLESQGWVSRHYEPTVPPQVTYALTDRVLELKAVIEELDRIAERWYGPRRTRS